MEISNIIPLPTLAGFVAVIGLLGAVLRAIYNRGGKERTIEDTVKKVSELDSCLREFKNIRAADREADRIKIEQQFTALHAGVHMLKDQVAEFRTEVTRVYATREEAAKIEERLNSALTRLFAHIDSLSKELRTMNAQIIEAISDRNHQIDAIRKKVEG
jgi:predicted  nucleic acid-binding Zn-ribbon protein